MATIKDWKIGDAPPPGYRLVRELVALPTSRELILKALGDILAKNVQKVVVEIRKPIEVLRLAKESEVGPMVEDIQSDDLYGMIRNAAMEPVEFAPNAPVIQRLMDLFERIHRAGMSPVGCLCGDDNAVVEWLGYKIRQLDSLMGVPLTTHAEVPGDVVLVACRLMGEPEGIDQSFKFTLDMPEVQK